VTVARKIGEGFVRVRPELSGFEAEARRELDGPLARLNARLRQRISQSRLGEAIARAVGRGAVEAAPAAGRAGDGAGRRFGDGFAAAARRRLRGMLPGLLRVVAIGAVVAVLGSLAAHAVAVTAALLPMVGALAAVPGVAFASAAGLGSLLLALGGIAAAWKESGKASAGGAAASRAAARQVAAAQRQVETAQRSLSDTQREARRAQEELTEARKTAAERLEDLSRSLAGARLDEEAAVLAVARAQEELERTRADQGATAMDVAEADLAYRQSLQTLAEVRDRVGDLAAEQTIAARTGVEGSEEVRQALERQADAARAVQDAQRQLVDAHAELATAGQSSAGGVDKAAEAMARLAPAARQLVTVGRELAETWRTRVQVAVQQATFAGVAGELRLLSDALLPTMQRRLVGIGGAWNEAILATSGLVRSRGFVEDLDATLGHATLGARLLGRVWPPVISGLRHLGVVGGGFLPRIARWVLQIAQRFDAWAAAARRSGRAQQWIERGGEVLRQVGRIARNVGGAVRALFAAGGDSGRTLDSIEKVTANMRDWLASAEGQAKVRAFFSGLRAVLASVVQVVPQLVGAVLELGPALQRAGEQDALADTLSVGAVLMGFLAENIDKVTAVLPYLIAGFIAFRTVQAAANVAQALSPVLSTAQVIANLRLAASQRALTAQLRAQRVATIGQAAAQTASTTATNAGAAAARRSIVAMAAQRVAMVAGRAATIAQTAVNWLLAASTWAALGPVLLVIAAIALLVGGLVLAYKRSDTFRRIVDASFKAVGVVIRWWWENVVKRYFQLVATIARWLWGKIQQAFAGWKIIFDRVRDWLAGVRDRFGRFLEFVTGIPGAIKRGFSKLVDILSAPFRAAFRAIARAWNNTIGGRGFTAPDWLPFGMGGKSFTIPTLPELAKGGVLRARRGGTLFVGGEGGEDEAVAPLSTLAGMIRQAIADGFRGRGSGGDTHVHVHALSPFSLPQVLRSLEFAGAS
jgi:hypothetical protein